MSSFFLFFFFVSSKYPFCLLFDGAKIRKISIRSKKIPEKFFEKNSGKNSGKFSAIKSGAKIDPSGIPSSSASSFPLGIFLGGTKKKADRSPNCDRSATEYAMPFIFVFRCIPLLIQGICRPVHKRSDLPHSCHTLHRI